MVMLRMQLLFEHLWISMVLVETRALDLLVSWDNDASWKTAHPVCLRETDLRYVSYLNDYYKQ